MEFREIVAGFEGTRPTLSLCNVDVAEPVLDAVGRYVRPRHVSVRRTTTDHGLPKNVAVLHDGERFRAASDVRELYRFADPAAGAAAATDIDAVEVPAVVRELDDTTVWEYGKRRMILASREVEKRAWDAGAGTLHAGFQRLSLVGSQRRIYEKLASTDLDVHVYGVPDADPQEIEATVHGHDADEIAESWFVVYDGEDRRSALLARETPAADTYRGFWTDRDEVVDAVRDRLREAYR